MGSRGERPARLSARPVARQHSIAVLQLSHHGRPGNNPHRDHGALGVFLTRRSALPDEIVALGLDVRLAISLYRDYCGLDDGGTWPSTLVDLRTDAYGSGQFAAGFRRQWVVHAARFYGFVYRVERSVPLFDIARDWTRTYEGGGITHGNDLVLPRRNH